MLIRDIKDKELRELAIKRCETEYHNDLSIVGGFIWEDTKEGQNFWSEVEEGIITNLITVATHEELRACLVMVRSQLFDVNNKETILTNAIDSVLNK
jgi:hypothetical protein